MKNEGCILFQIEQVVVVSCDSRINSGEPFIMKER